MKTTFFILSISAALIFPKMVGGAELHVEPTLLPPGGRTLVTATISGGRFYSGTVPPPYRIRLFNQNQLLNLLEPEKISPTRLTFDFPSLQPGYYGFLVRAQDPGSGAWVDVYRSSPRFFKVDPDVNLARVFSVSQAGMPTVQKNPWEFLDTTNLTARGTITGRVTVPHYVNDGDEVLNLDWTGDFPGSGENGVRFKLDFILEGQATYIVTIPFEINYDLPTKAYNGQTVHFKARSISFPGGETLEVDHALDYSTDHAVWVNAPYDCLPPIDLFLSQKPDRLKVQASVPIAPCLDPVSVAFDFFGDFADGDAEFYGVRNRLGGQVQYVNRLSTGGRIEASGEVFRRIFSGTTENSGLWYSSGDQIAFLARAGLSYVSAAAAVLDGDPPNVDLEHYIELKLVSTDSVQLKQPSLYDLRVTVPQRASGTDYRLISTCSFPVSSSLVSQYVYKLTSGFMFDMICIDPQPLGSFDLAPIYSANIKKDLDLTARFPVEATIEVVPSPVWGQQFAPGVDLSITAVDVMNFALADKIAEELRLDGLILTEPKLPPIVSTKVMMPLAPKPGSEFVLMLSALPAGAGTITADPPPLDGGYAMGAVVTVTAHAASGYSFSGWSGDLSGQLNPAKVTMSNYRNVSANFVSLPALRTQVVQGGLMLSWDPALTGFQLETAETLTPPSMWEPVVGVTSNQATVPVSGTARFYRLRLLE